MSLEVPQLLPKHLHFLSDLNRKFKYKLFYILQYKEAVMELNLV